MAIIKCPECGGTVSDKAYSCPHCGYPIMDKISYTENQYQGKEIQMYCPHCGYQITDKIGYTEDQYRGYQKTDKIGYTENQYEGKETQIFGIIFTIIGLIFIVMSFKMDHDIGMYMLPIGIITVIIGAIFKFVGRAKYWYHN